MGRYILCSFLRLCSLQIHHFREITNASVHRRACVCQKDTYVVAMIRNYQDVHFKPEMSTYCDRVISHRCIKLMKYGLQLLLPWKPPPGIDGRITFLQFFTVILESVTPCLISQRTGHFLQVFMEKLKPCTLWPQSDHTVSM